MPEQNQNTPNATGAVGPGAELVSGETSATAVAPEPPPPPVEDRPFRKLDLTELEEQLTEVTLREHYSIQRGDKQLPYKGPRRLGLSLRDAHAHKVKLHEYEAIKERWDAIQREKEHRRAERNLDPNKPRRSLSQPTPAN